MQLALKNVWMFALALAQELYGELLHEHEPAIKDLVYTTHTLPYISW